MVISLSTLLQPGPGFDEPLDMLAACHDRILDQCLLLEKLQRHVSTQGADAAAREAGAGILRYFDLAGENHHQDEERDLFPALQRKAGGQSEVVDKLIRCILAEHELMRQAWAVQLRPRMLALCDGLAALKPDSIAHFTRLYRQHIQREQEELLPLARQILGDAELLTMGHSMSARRTATRVPADDTGASRLSAPDLPGQARCT